MSSSAASVADLIKSKALLRPDLSRAKRKALIDEIHAETGASVSTIYEQLKRAAEGKPARKPRADRGTCRSLDPEVQAAARALFTSKRWAKSPTELLRRELQHRFPQAIIGYDSLQRLRDNTERELARYGRVYRTVEVEAPNQEWQIDCSVADFFCLMPGRQVPIRPQLTVCSDSCTRSILYARYSARTGWEELGGILYGAIIMQSPQWPQCGLPHSIVMDWGKNFTGENITAALAELGIERVLAHPHTPTDKGKIERCIGTVHRVAEALLPGYCGSDNKGEYSVDPHRDLRQLAPGTWVDLRYPGDSGDARRVLSLQEANRYLWDWISGWYNHEHVIRTIGVTPAQAWAASGIQPRMVPEDRLRSSFLSRTDARVRRSRIQCNSLQYLAPELLSYNGLRVEVRYDPSDIRRIYVYYDGVFRCAAEVDNPLFADRPLDQRAFDETRRQNREIARQRRQLLAEWQHDITSQDPTDQVAAALAAAPSHAGPAPIVSTPPPAGLTETEAAELEGLSLGAIPLAAGQ